MPARNLPLRPGRLKSATPGAANFRGTIRTCGLACVFACVLGLFLSGCGINNIPAYQEIARAKWSNVLYEYSRRGDLVGELVEVVQVYVAQERQPLDDVVSARARAHQVVLNMPTEILNEHDAFQQFAQAQAEFTSALTRLLAACERYGDLKANANFSQLVSRLGDAENRIATARRDYNGAVERYNRELRTFPGAIWGATLYHNNKPMQTFSGDTS
jgi:LemA protein